MANEMDNTALNASVQELWDHKVAEARYIKGVIWNKMWNSSETAKKKGDIVRLSIDQRYTVGAVGADGSFTPQNYTLGTAAVTLDQWNQVAIEETDRVKAQSFWLPSSNFPSKSGEAFASYYDFTLAAQHESFTTEIGGTSPADIAIFDKNLAQEALYRRSLANVPMEDLYFFIHESAYFKGLCNETQLTDADKTGYDRSVLITGKQFTLFNVPVYTTNNIALSGSVRKNLLLHKEAIALAFQYETEFESQRAIGARKATTVFFAGSLWGFTVFRTDYGYVINSKA